MALLLETENAEHAAKQVMAEFEDVKVTGMSVARWGKGLNVKLREGRPVGHTTSPYRERALQLLAEGKNQSEIARELGVTRQAISKILKS